LAQELWRLATGCERSSLLAGNCPEAEPEQVELFEHLVERAAKGESLAYLEGSAGFFGLEFTVGPAVLVPRADSECLVEWALELISSEDQAKVLDLGTGSGCLLLSILHQRSQAIGVGVDICAEALKLAETNCRQLGLEARCQLLQSDWYLELGDACFDLIISNPPYVEPNEETGFGVIQNEPHLALFTELGDPMEPYRRILGKAADHLSPGGGVLLEIGAGRAGQVAELCVACGFEAKPVRKDLGGIERVLYACLPASS
jgi:release factor glutamine methyltransferase